MRRRTKAIPKAILNGRKLGLPSHNIDDVNGPRLNDCSMKHYLVLNMALFSHAHVTISAEIKLTHACSRGDVSHERTAAA